MRTFLKEFKDFIATGNMVELAVAVILGAAVGAVIKAFTEGIMMQIVAAIFGKPNFDDVTIDLRKGAALQVGTFINQVITLLLTGLALFLMIKAYNRMKRKAAEEPATDPGPSEIELLTEIRDALRARPPA
jgi:large conductance mechanosensitive channel